MLRRPLKTYGKDPNKNRPDSVFTKRMIHLHNVFDSSNSDSDIFETSNKTHSITNPFESTFDRIARTAKLPPIPSDQSKNSSILYVSSSSSSSWSDEDWIPHMKSSPQNPPKKIINEKRRKKTESDKQININKIRLKNTLIANKKRHSNLQDVDNNKKTSIEVLQPQRKIRRTSKKQATFISHRSSGDSNTNPSSAIASPSTNKIKSYSVESTQVITTDPSLENDEKSQSIVDTQNTTHNKQLAVNTTHGQIPLVNQHGNKFTNIRDCHIILSRLDVDNMKPSKFSLTPTPQILSSTPFNHRILPLNSKLSFSPINKMLDNTFSISNTTEIDESSGICKTTINEANLLTEKNSFEKSSLEQSMKCTNEQTQFRNDAISDTHTDKKIKSSLIDDKISTKLLFETNNSIKDLNKNTASTLDELHTREKTINLTEIKEKDADLLNFSAAENNSRSMFEETKLSTDNVVHESISHRESYKKACEAEAPSTNSNKIDSDIKNGTLSSSIVSTEHNTSLISRTTNTIDTANLNNDNTSSGESARVSNKDTSDDSYHLHVLDSSSNSNSLDANSKEISHRKFIDVDSSGLSITNVDNELNHTNMMQPIVLLTRLDDSVKITKRRGKNMRWDNQLKTITESFNKRASIKISRQRDESQIKKSNSDEYNESCSRISVPMKNVTSRYSRRSNSHAQNKNRLTIYDESKNDDNIKTLYLKPGKSWARSLSILNHINNKDDIEILSIGKGKKWRQSVKNVLDMQSQGVLQSCVKNKVYENDEYAESVGVRRSNVTRISSSTITGTMESTSPGRFIRRISIRVVPDKKYSKIENKDIRDTSFYEVYGISRSKNHKTLENKTLIAPRDTFVYNLRCSNVNVTTVLPKPAVAARNVVLQQCNQSDYIPFEECYPDSFLEQCRKIGEGVYGEVFLFENKKQKSVIKIIPIEGEQLVNGEPQKKFCEILSEIIIAKELHDLRFNNLYRTNGFIEVKNIRCLIGKYPQKLIEHWRVYDEEKSSDNDCPSMFTDDQLYIALELGHGGKDLEAFVFQNANEAYSSFIQTALSLAVAEKSLDFEHRDLHWGNILLSRTTDTEMSYKLDTEEITVQCKGIKVAIIDFTLSRMSYRGCCMFNDLALDPALFTAVGEYQFEIYRLMKAKVGNNWQLFEPYTNILWLHYVLDKMITSVRYKKITTKIHKNGILKLQELKNELLNYDSAYDFIINCDKLSLHRRSFR